MPRHRRTLLPPVTEDDKHFRPDQLRATPNGGYAWRCHYCNRYASSETQAGKYVCYAHGGIRARHRDRVTRAQAIAKGDQPPRPPGRPMKHGFYAKGERVEADELVELYNSLNLDPDETTEDLLYLRAYLAELLSVKPEIDELSAQLCHLTEAIANSKLTQTQELSMYDSLVTDCNSTPAVQPYSVKALEQHLKTVTRCLQEFERYSAQLEKRHLQIIKAVNIRADIRVKNKVLEDVTLFSALLERFMLVLSEMLSPEAYCALQQRIEQDINEIPKRLLECHSVMNKSGA